MYKKRAVLTSQFAVRELQKQLQSAMQTHLDQSASFGLLPLDPYVTANRNVSFNSIIPLKVTQHATNRNKHINEEFEQIFADNLFKIPFKYTQHILFNGKICFNVFNIRTYDDM